LRILNLKALASYIEGVSARAAAGDSEPDDVEGVAVAFVQAQQHYTHNEPCAPVVAALAPPATLREARAGLAAALSAQPNCGSDAKTLTPAAIAKELKVSQDTVIAWITSGKLKGSNIGQGKQRGRYVVTRDALTEFLASRQPTPPPARTPRTPRRGDDSFKHYRS
jgi:hypothetical protein